MTTVTGIFNSRVDAERAIENLRSANISEERINLLTPGTSTEEIEKAVPTTETEQPGMGGALGGTVGGALGIAGGMHLGATIASLFIPGVGPVIAAGLLGAAIIGAGGAATGIAAGNAIEEGLAKGLPHDELYVYEDALRRGRSVVIAFADDDAKADTARGIIAQSGAEGIDAARENWWVGLRDAEEAEYTGEGRDFKTDEPVYRRGFEAALHPSVRGKSYDEASENLKERYSDAYGTDVFRRGYERGHAYHKGLREKHQS